ncbi:MAG: PQQ-binding-like beta-propeller repeat protein [Planctomycetes bacterium]|nr:PQQ-binding-like beta-propeller repeat protein [Planctomycetota bacterium]MBI3843353.1 PQQ-binding-like beta-propeller repeat protein [Planctomycetota bacterium]
MRFVNRSSSSSLVALLVGIAFVLGAAISAAQPAVPRIDGLSAAAVARSGRLRISGANFGAAQSGSQVQISGQVAPVTRWTDGLITAYVPESSPLGSVVVQVTTSSGASNPFPLTVNLRESAGRVRWRFQADSQYVIVRPAVGPDSTVYAVDVDGHLYALRPDGSLAWIVNGAGNKGVDVGADGTIYAGSEDAITAVNPDGSIQWVYQQSPRAFITLGPNVGPDGNIYAVSAEGEGIFSLTPAGTRRWRTPESYRRRIVDYQELVFGPGPGGTGNQMYFNANDHFCRVDTANGQRTDILTGGWSQPVVGPDGTVYNGNNGAMAAFRPDGSLRWSNIDWPLNVGSPPDVGSDGRVYHVRNLASLTARNGATGSTVWTYQDGTILDMPIVSPDNSVIAMSGYPNYGQPGFFKGVSTTGQFLWQVDLAFENGGNLIGFTRPRFSGDGLTAYYGTAIAGVDQTNAYSYVYAIDPTPAGTGGGPLTFSQSPLQRGQIVEFRVTNAAAGETAFFFASRRGLGAGPCYPELGGLCLDLVAPVRFAGTAVANASGTAILARRAPAGTPLVTFTTQAAVARGAASVKTNTITATVLP